MDSTNEDFLFLDQNGVALNPGDRIEYWSQRAKDWIPSEVDSLEFLCTVKGVKRKLLVVPDHRKGRGYYDPGRQALTSSKNVRKV